MLFIGVSMGKICIVLEVYNEEKRIKECIESFLWADYFYIFCKPCTDKTKEILTKYNVSVVDVPYCDVSENWPNNIKLVPEDAVWVFPITASSRIDPSLAEIVLAMCSISDADVLCLPYKFFAFGVDASGSPWGIRRKNAVFRRNHLMVKNIPHQEFSSSSKNIFFVPISAGYLRHQTHLSLESYLERTIRYCSKEGELVSSHDTGVFWLVKVFFNSFIRRGIFWLFNRRLRYLSIAYFVNYLILYLHKNRNDVDS